jgi:hypothetical protein
MSAKLKEFTAEAHLSAVGNSKGYIFKNDLLAEAGVKPNEAFRVLVTARKIIFEYPKSRRSGKIVPRPLSYYLRQRTKRAEPVVANEIWPDDAPRGREALG